jgi:electron transfer flavoprotein alpha subunit
MSWGFADMVDDSFDDAPTELTEIKSDDWRNILVFGRATTDGVYPETLALVSHARYLANELGCRVEVALIGEDIDAAVEVLKKYPIDNIYKVKAPKYAPIDQAGLLLEGLIKKRRPEMVFIFQSRSGDALTAYVASRLGVGFVLGASKVTMDTMERRAIVTHQAGNTKFQTVTRMLHQPQLVSVQSGMFRAPMEDPYSSTKIFDVELDVTTTSVKVLGQKEPMARTLENADTVLVAGSRIRNKEEMQLAKDLAAKLGAVFGVTRAAVDRNFATADLIVGKMDKCISPRLLVCVGVTGSMEFVEGIKGKPTTVAIGVGDDDPILKHAGYRVTGTLAEGIVEVSDKL